MESLQVVDAEVFIERDDNGVCTLTRAIEPSTGKERDPKDIKPGTRDGVKSAPRPPGTGKVVDHSA